MITIGLLFVSVWFLAVVVFPTLVHRYDRVVKITEEFKNLKLPQPSDPRWHLQGAGPWGVECGPITMYKALSRISVKGVEILNFENRPPLEKKILCKLINNLHDAVVLEIWKKQQLEEDRKRIDALQVFRNFVK